MILSDNQTKKIQQFLTENYAVKRIRIKEEMIDHFCCLVEEKMSTGIPFEEAFNQVSKILNPKEVRSVERKSSRVFLKKRMKRKFKSVSMVAASFILLLVVGADAQIKPTGPPVKSPVEITSKYGMRKKPNDDKKRFHRGVDIKAEIGTPIYATADGVIELAEYSKTGYGNRIVINHKDSYETVFAHLSKLIVKQGEKVNQGDLIGYTGNSGFSKGPHLHYEIKKDGKIVNPLPFITAVDSDD